MTDKQDAELIRMIRQEKAEAAIRAVAAGANPTIEAYLLANDFTDSVTDSLAKRIKRWMRRA
ncbi:hypothetical protein BH11ACT2_BH11ACT2_23270 [soil metagenome]